MPYITSLPSLGQLPLLRDLSVKCMDGVTTVGAEHFGIGSSAKTVPSLEGLIIEDMLNWKQRSWSNGLEEKEKGNFLIYVHLNYFISLSEIDNCNGLMYLWLDGTDLHELASLKHLEIKKCEHLVSLVDVEQYGDLEQLPNGLQCLASLRDLKINHCPKLISFPGGLPYVLQHLEISECDALKSIPDGMMKMMSGSKGSQCLQELLISWCSSLKSIPRGMLPIMLKSLAISWCKILETLLEGIMYDGGDRRELSRLEHLNIDDFSLLPFPTFEFPASLKTLEIAYCTTQSPSPCVTYPISLNWKEVSVLGGLSPNFIKLEIRCCENVKEPMSDWGVRTLIFLKRPVIEGTSPCTKTVSFPDDEGPLLPT
ncbi:unnamed protein product [Dovyalis caffra]|uniref:Disease resistance protein n=1 Tax=Dovyalis caffra TaxID=77055 RepID=A0AAV1RD56_9ROSI|nr:unnamed protein product [Dovyalis caffra]